MYADQATQCASHLYWARHSKGSSQLLAQNSQTEGMLHQSHTYNTGLYSLERRSTYSIVMSSTVWACLLRQGAASLCTVVVLLDVDLSLV